MSHRQKLFIFEVSCSDLTLYLSLISFSLSLLFFNNEMLM